MLAMISFKSRICVNDGFLRSNVILSLSIPCSLLAPLLREPGENSDTLRSQNCCTSPLNISSYFLASHSWLQKVSAMSMRLPKSKIDQYIGRMKNILSTPEDSAVFSCSSLSMCIPDKWAIRALWSVFLLILFLIKDCTLSNLHFIVLTLLWIIWSRSSTSGDRVGSKSNTSATFLTSWRLAIANIIYHKNWQYVCIPSTYMYV